VTFQFGTFVADGFFQLLDAVIEAANLIDDDAQFDLHDLVKGKIHNLLQLLVAGKGFLAQVHSPRRKHVVDLVLQ